MKKTIKLTEKDLTRIVKKVVNEGKNTLFPFSSDDTESMKASPGWERRRSEKGAKMSGEIYNDIMNEIKEFEKDMNKNNITYFNDYVNERIENINNKINISRHYKNLPKNKIDELEKELINVCENLYDKIEEAFITMRRWFPNRRRVN